MGKKAHTNTVLSKGGVEEEDRQLVSSSPLFRVSSFLRVHFYTSFLYPARRQKEMMGRNFEKRSKKKDRRRKKDREKKKMSI